LFNCSQQVFIFSNSYMISSYFKMMPCFSKLCFWKIMVNWLTWSFLYRKMLDLQHQYNNCTTIPHMRVGPTYWSPPSCEGLLYWCCTRIKSLLYMLLDGPTWTGHIIMVNKWINNIWKRRRKKGWLLVKGWILVWFGGDRINPWARGRFGHP
jgi:hypothetical protein